MKIMSFNLENLFNRYLFLDAPHVPDEKKFLPTGVGSFDRFGNAQSEAITQVQRNNTARVILDAAPDILAVVEVEDLRALRLFNDEYLSNHFDRMIMLEGNDARGINVGLCIKHGFEANVVAVRSHADESTNGFPVNRYFDPATNVLQARNALFSRDCLEVDIDVGGKQLTVLVSHFKSQLGDAKESNGTRAKQAKRVAELVADVKKRGRLPVVLGDLNADWNETMKKDGTVVPTPAAQSLVDLKQLVDGGQLADPFPAGPDLWTHYYVPFNEVSRLDYILLDPSLATGAKTSFHRKGLTLKCKQAGPPSETRYPTIGYVGTEASDHCGVSVEIAS